jgi:oligopeptide transport system permease protein
VNTASPTGARRRGSTLLATSTALLVAIAIGALILPALSPNSVEATDYDRILAAPGVNEMHWFGTDDLGRDQLVRTMQGTQITLTVALVASLVSVVIGVLYGAIAGYAGGRVDALMMRFVDTLYAMPFIFFVILLMVVFERNFLLVFVAIGAVNWLDMARIVRGQTLSLREREFVQAARLVGAPPLWIILRHIAPNLAGIVVVYATLTIPQAILVESFLSFLGLGIQEPRTSLGTLVANGVNHLESAPWMLLLPGGLLALILLCFNFLGDGLRDRLDARRAQ